MSISGGIVLTALAVGVFLALDYRSKLHEARRMARLRAIGDAHWEGDEVQLWRTGIDPCPDLPDLTELESEEWAREKEALQGLSVFDAADWGVA